MPSIQTKKKPFNFKGPFTADRHEFAQVAAAQDKHRLASMLAQINLASCFQNEEEPLFEVQSPVIYKALEE